MELNFNIKNPDRKELRKFGITLFIALSILGGLLLWKKGNVGIIFFSIGGCFLLVGLISPKYLKYTYILWMKFAILLGFIMNHLILALLYYLVVTPIGLTMKLFDKNPLLLKVDKNKKSYWIVKPKVKFLKEKYEKMF